MTQIPMFEGSTVRTLALSATGTIADELLQPAEPLELGDSVIVVCVGTVLAVNHKMKDGIVTRHRTINFGEVLTLDWKEGSEVLDAARNRAAEMRADAKAEAEEAAGIARLPLDGPKEIEGMKPMPPVEPLGIEQTSTPQGVDRETGEIVNPDNEALDIIDAEIVEG